MLRLLALCLAPVQATASATQASAPAVVPELSAALEAGDECLTEGQCALSALQRRLLKVSGAASSAPASATGAAFATNAERTQSFAWTPATRTAGQALGAAFHGRHVWQSVRFTEGLGGPWTWPAVVQWVELELLGGPDPFAAHGGKVPLPASAGAGREDVLGPGQWVAYSRRQVCFIVAKSLLGAGTMGYANGLLRFMEQDIHGSGRMARTGDFGRSWWGLLAACAADPGLAAGRQGPVLIAAKAGHAPSVQEVRAASATAPLAAAGLRVCSYDDGTPALAEGLTPVPAAGCSQPSPVGPGRDFMTGGLPGQAVQDISAAWLGGYVFGNADGLGGGQDERLMVYMPEVSALAFFLSQNPGTSPQLRQPAWILGARKLALGLDGTCRFNAPVVWDATMPLVSDLAPVTLAGQSYQISTSMPFLAFQSENQGFSHGFLGPARENKDPLQRDVDPASRFAFDKQVRAWYRSVALTSYAPELRPVLRALVRSVGTGPWLAGLWFGDSQLGFLASWLGQAAAAASWDGELNLDYYIYSSFTENPGNQCYVHSAAACGACLSRCGSAPLSRASYWLPSEAYTGRSPCITNAGACGQKGLEHVVRAYADKGASALWGDLEMALRRSNGDTTESVFDLLLN